MRRICPRRLCRRGAGRGSVRGPGAVTNAFSFTALATGEATTVAEGHLARWEFGQFCGGYGRCRCRPDNLGSVRFPGLEFEQQWLNDQGVLSLPTIAGAAGPREL